MSHASPSTCLLLVTEKRAQLLCVSLVSVMVTVVVLDWLSKCITVLHFIIMLY